MSEQELAPARIGMSSRPRLWSQHSMWRDVFEIVLLILVIYTFVNLATARAVVEGNSMQPNFHTGQLVIVNRFTYFFSDPLRGDVVVLHNPRNANEDLIKRVIGLPNEIVQIKEGRVYANGTLLEEPYVNNYCVACSGTWTLGPDEYFVLGDNRSNSHDSHNFGPINRHLIVGQAWIRHWPLTEFAIINHPTYGQVAESYTLPPPTPTRVPPTLPPDIEPGGSWSGM